MWRDEWVDELVRKGRSGRRLATFGSVFLTQAALPGIHPTATAIAQTLWLIVAALVGCAIASSVMVRAQPARVAASGHSEAKGVEVAGDAA